MTAIRKIRETLGLPVPAVSLALFRIIFGVLMFGGILRFMLKDWVYDLYIAPDYFFSYYGFEWIPRLGADATYAVFAMLAILALFVAAGLFYRVSISLFFLLFTYTELLDKANYLNHYYFISMMSLLMCFLPLDSCYSLDILLKPAKKKLMAPRWALLAIQTQIASVYFFGGVAKIKHDWLFEAQPLRIWLSANTNLPLIGPLMDNVWLAYILSWFAMIFDLSVAAFLFRRSTRIYAWLVLLIFHILTAVLFQIGMFPYIMMSCSLVFFSAETHRKWLDGITGIFTTKKSIASVEETAVSRISPLVPVFLLPFFLIQVLLPFRHLLYPGDVCWSEEGFRYAWHIMLCEKSGHVEYRIRDLDSGKYWTELPKDYLTPNQVKQMSFQPDMILQFAHFLAGRYRSQGRRIEIFADAYASLNGRPARPLIDPSVNLAAEQENIFHKNWIVPYSETETPLRAVAP